MSQPQPSNAASPATSSVARVPATREELEHLAAERPPGWEYLIFAGVLLQGKQALGLKWRDHQLRIPTGSYHRVDENDVADYLGEAFGRLGWIIEPMSRVFAAQEDAFGQPGEPGDEQLIEHFAGWIVSTYRRLLEWAGTVRSAGVPEEFERTFELAAQAADQPLDEIRAFLDEIATKSQQLSAHCDTPEAEREPLLIAATLSVTMDKELMAEAVEELRTALGL